MKAWLRQLLPPALRLSLRQWLAKVQLLLVRLFAVNGFTASLYYTFFSRQFYREHKAVLKGRLNFAAKLKKPDGSSVRLRRNIHRLEKGLIMQPRKALFAEAYIADTVAAYQKAQQSGRICQQELNWATDVLYAYFAAVQPNASIVALQTRFNAVAPQRSSEHSAAVPYAQKTLPTNPVSYSALLTLFQRRRSVRWYQNKAIDSALLHQAIAAAALAPSACNRQPFQFYLINNAEKAAAIAKCAMGTVGFADNIPCLIAIVGDLSAYEAERDRHVIYIDAALAAMQLMLALETLGLQSCPINWPDVEARERMLAKKLALDYYQRPVMLLATGYAEPEGGVAFSQKKTSELLIKDLS
jgi:nitroreductase